MFLSAPFVILFFILEQFARAIGAPMVSMIGMLASVRLKYYFRSNFNFWF